MRILSGILVVYLISTLLFGQLIYVARGRFHYHKRRGLSDPPPPPPPPPAVTANPPQVPSDPYPNPNPDPAPGDSDSGCIFDVTSFGAVGDGSCDDTAAFKAAWKAACAVESSVVLAPEGGVFKITSTIFSGPCKPGLVFQVSNPKTFLLFPGKKYFNEQTKKCFTPVCESRVNKLIKNNHKNLSIIF